MSGKLVVTICKARHLIPCDVGGTSDPFVVLTMGNVTKRTKVASSTLHPTWDETFVFQGTRKKIGLTLQIFDKDLIGSSDFMGMVQLDFDADRAYTMVGEAWLPLHERRGKNIDSAKQKNYGEIYVRWWYRFNQLGNIMLAGNISDDSKANADIPSLNMTILKTGIARATAALFGCLQPYYWMMRLFVWESLSSSFISLYVISWLWWHGKLHTLLPMLLTGTMIMNFIRFYRWGPDGKVSPQRQSSNSLTDTLDWYRETLHRAQLLTGRVTDVGDRIAKIFSWGFPGTSLKVLRICFSILLISVLGIMPTSSFLFFIALLYLFTIYPLSCNFPDAYAILLAREFKTRRIETSVLKDGNVSDGDSDGDVNVKYVLETNATELRNEETPVWVDKNKKLRCRTCGVSFGLVNRRKHCRSCGDVYCGKCCLVVSLDKVPFFVTSGNVKKARICNVCIAILVNHTMLWRGGIQVDILGGSLSLKTRVSMLIHNWRPLKNPKMTISLGDVCQILNYEIVTFTRSDMPNQYLLETRSVRYTLTLVDPDATRVHADALMALLT